MRKRLKSGMRAEAGAVNEETPASTETISTETASMESGSMESGGTETGGTQTGIADSPNTKVSRPQTLAEKMWYGVRVLSKQGSFAISDLVQIVDGCSYSYVRKFLRYLYKRGIVTCQKKGEGTDWKRMIYMLVEGAEKPEPLYRDPYIYDQMQAVKGGHRDTQNSHPPISSNNKGQDGAPSPNEPAPPLSTPGQGENPGQDNSSQSGPTGDPLEDVDAGLNTEPDQPDPEKIKTLQAILNGYYEDLVTRIQYLNCIVHKIRTDAEMEYLPEAYLLLDAIRISTKLYYTKILQASKQADLAVIFARAEMDEAALEEIRNGMAARYANNDALRRCGYRDQGQGIDAESKEMDKEKGFDSASVSTPGAGTASGNGVRGKRMKPMTHQSQRIGFRL